MTRIAPPPSRRAVLAGLSLLPLAPRLAAAAGSREITWDDLIPAGVPYSEITGPGTYDEANDIWIPEFDANGARTVDAFDGMNVRLPGYIVPLEYDATDKVTGFLLAPFMGACIHVPPPPPNQLVYVTSERGWPGEEIWDAVWVTGAFRSNASRTALAEAGYEMRAGAIELYEW